VLRRKDYAGVFAAGRVSGRDARLRERALARLVFVSGGLTTMRPVLPTVLPN
jgi:hypothetical protein